MRAGMSCSSQQDDVDGTRRHGHGAREGPALDMLDEYWFFSNTLGGKVDGRGRRPPMLPKSPSTSTSSAGGRTKGGGVQGGGGARGHGSEDPAGKSRLYASGCRRQLLRTPSLPSPRVGMDPSSKDEEIVEEAEAAGGGGDQEVVEVEDDDLNWSSIYEGVLRTRIAEEGGRSSALHRAPSMPVPSSATMGGRCEETAVSATKSTPSMPRLRHSHSTLERHCRSHTPAKPDRMPRTTGGGGGARGQPRRELRSFSANQQPAIVRQKSVLQDKKWKSSSDLESIEVQGFKDLGFVFDEEELRESLADVLPGLRDSKTKPKTSGSGSASDNDDVNGIGIGISNASSGGGGGDGTVRRRPYLSEAWHQGARSAPPAAARIRLQQADARSAAEMKDQIRMWAQAVACNVRQEC